ncbi:MAG: hypothetical protein ACR2OF_00630 [Hyphomicrobium sp.]
MADPKPEDFIELRGQIAKLMLTCELRFVLRDDKSILQQKWTAKVDIETRNVWRDVPLVEGE